MGVKVIQGYGMTEAAALITVNHPFNLSRRSIGKTLPGHEVKLDERGEILVRGDNVSPGYWGTELRPISGGLLLQDADGVDQPGDDQVNWTLACGDALHDADFAELADHTLQYHAQAVAAFDEVWNGFPPPAAK